MTINGPFFHPAWAFLALALGMLFLRGTWWRFLLVIPPLIAFWAVVHMQEGSYLVIPYLGQEMVLGRVDRLSKLFANVFAVEALICMIYALHVTDRAHHAAASFYVAGALGAVFAGDYLTLFIFWEMMSVSSTFLVWLNRKPVSIRAGLRYFLFHTMGGLFILAGLLLRYRAAGSLAFIAVSPESAQFFDWLIMFGFCVNAAVIPLHGWLPDTYPEATVPGAVFMCTFTTKTAVYALLRGFAGFEVLTVAGTVMAVYGVLYAVIENDARRMLSYHLVSEVGYMVAGIGIGTVMTINGAAVHGYSHIIYKGLLFMGAGCLLSAAGTDRLDRLGGLVRRLPWVMVFYMVGALSISGAPFFNGFISRNMTIHGATEAYRPWIGTILQVAAVGTFVTVGLKLPYFAFWAKPDSKIELKPIAGNMYVAMGIAAALCLAMGVYPQMVYRILPHPVSYAPFEALKVLQAVLLLGFTGLGFYFMRNVITPTPGRNLDFDTLYRLVGNTLVAAFTRPLAALDDRWSQLYRRVGLTTLMASARWAESLDRRVIDSVVDGAADMVRSTGRLFRRIQTGRLQDYLAWMTVVAMLVFAAIWWLADRG